MEYQEFKQAVQHAIDLVETSRLKEAEEALYKLILSDISDVDKAALCARLAEVYDKTGNSDEALAWYDKGIASEQVYCRFEVAEKKAQYLSILGRGSDGVAIYESLLKQPFVSEGDKDRMRQMIKSLLSKSLRGWN